LKHRAERIENARHAEPAVTEPDAKYGTEHEALCRRCARCCYEKLIVDGRVFTTRKPCSHLDVKTNLCRVYDRRFEANPRCLSVAQGIELGVFPADCPYVRDLPDYMPAEEGWLEPDAVRKIDKGLLFNHEDIREEIRKRSQQEG